MLTKLGVGVVVLAYSASDCKVGNLFHFALNGKGYLMVRLSLLVFNSFSSYLNACLSFAKHLIYLVMFVSQ
jgi:hypothetical protein